MNPYKPNCLKSLENKIILPCVDEADVFGPAEIVDFLQVLLVVVIRENNHVELFKELLTDIPFENSNLDICIQFLKLSESGSGPSNFSNIFFLQVKIAAEVG